jgi:L-cysteine/cystine lyase
VLDARAFRAEFPVLERLAYLNAGTEGPMPLRAAQAVHARIDAELEGGRCGRPFFEELMALGAQLRARYAGLIGAQESEVALTGSTTDGVNTVLAGLDLRAGEEILTTDEEHPGLLAPLAIARRRHGIVIRVVPFASLADAAREAAESARPPRLIACSHVSWATGQIADVPALAATGAPVLLDGAQAIGAVPVDVKALGCAFYAASGQKWLCGPEGSGCLYVAPDYLDDVAIPWGQYGSLGKGSDPLELDPAPGAKRFDHGFPSGLRSTWALAALDVFEQAGWDGVFERAASLAAQLAADLAAAGLTVAPRGRSTLVSWSAADPEAEVERLAGAGFVVRSIPGQGRVRASVGAWCSEDELAELVRVASAAG